MMSEQKARVSIDALLTQAGWHVCHMADANIHAARGVAIREFPLNTGYGFVDYLLYIGGKAAGVDTGVAPNQSKAEYWDDGEVLWVAMQHS